MPHENKILTRWAAPGINQKQGCWRRRRRRRERSMVLKQNSLPALPYNVIPRAGQFIQIPAVKDSINSNSK